MSSSAVNPMPQSPRFVNPDGSLTQEAYWFLLTMLTVVQQNESAANNPFAPPQTNPADSPVVQAIERLQAFAAPSTAITAIQQIKALLTAQAFTAQIGNALQRIAALEVLSAFRSQASSSGAVTEQAIANSEWLVNVSGTNTITGNTVTAYTELVAGFLVRLIPAVTNTNATTLNVNGTGAEAVTKNGASALVGGELIAGQAYLLLWDGTEWQILGQIGITFTLANGDILVGNASNVPTAVAPSGDVSMTNAGVFTVLSAAGNFLVSGNLEAVTAGKGLQIKGGSNARVGSGTLVGGTLAVANTSVTANTAIFITDQSGGVNIGSLYVASQTAGTGFTVSSTNVLDTSSFKYLLVEVL